MAKGSAARAALTPKPGEAFFSIRFTLEGVDEVVRGLRAIDARTGDLTPAWPAVDQVLRAIASQSFRSEGAQSGAPWQPLAPSTAAERRRAGFGSTHPILQRTGRLMRSLTSVTGDTITMHHEQSYAFGTADPTFVYHTSPRPRTKIPLRRIFRLTADQKAEVMQPVRVYLRGGDPTRSSRQIAKQQGGFQQTTGGA